VKSKNIGSYGARLGPILLFPYSNPRSLSCAMLEWFYEQCSLQFGWLRLAIPYDYTLNYRWHFRYHHDRDYTVNVGRAPTALDQMEKDLLKPSFFAKKSLFRFYSSRLFHFFLVLWTKFSQPKDLWPKENFAARMVRTPGKDGFHSTILGWKNQGFPHHLFRGDSRHRHL